MDWSVALVIYLWLMGGFLSAGAAKLDDQDLHWRAALLYVATWPLLVPVVIILAIMQKRIKWRGK